jgi:hypothetical protein
MHHPRHSHGTPPGAEATPPPLTTTTPLAGIPRHAGEQKTPREKQRPNGFRREGRVLPLPPLSPTPIDNTTQHNCTDFAQRSVSLCPRLQAWLDSLPRGHRSRIVHSALHARLDVEVGHAGQLRQEAERLERLIATAQVRLTLLRTKLTDFDEDLNREAAVRDDVALYLRSNPTEDGQRVWAAAKPIPWATFEKLREELRGEARRA